MSLPFSADLARRIAAVSEALLSPLVWPTRDAWWRETDRRIGELFPGATVMLSIPDGDRLRHFSEGVDDGMRRYLSDIMRMDPNGHLVTGDEATNRWLRWRRQTRTSVWGEWPNRSQLRALGTGIEECIWYNDGLVPAKLVDFVGMTSDLGSEEYFLCIGYKGLGHSRVGFDSEMALFEALLPAFRAGHHALQTFAERQTALGATLDAIDEALLVVGPDGREMHRNAALRAALAAEPEHERVVAALHDAARPLVAARTSASRAAPGIVLPTAAAPSAPERRVATPTARYVVRAAYASEAVWGAAGTVIVSLASGGAQLAAPGADDARAALRARFGLTAREAEVAALLGRRLTNPEIAAALGISAHTARHHVQRVLEKLGTRSRRALGAVLQEAGAA